MPRNHESLTKAQKAAFSALMKNARTDVPYSLNEAAAAANAYLEAWGLENHYFDFDYVRWLESSPATPLANPLRLSAALAAYELVWSQVLEVLGVPHAVR